MKWLHSPKFSYCLLGGIFLLLLLLNLLTPMYLDDYAYCFSWADGTRITSLAQIFPSMKAHASIMNGRLVCHFLVQLSLLLPTVLFKLINSAFFVCLLVILYTMCHSGKKKHPLFYLLLFLTICYFVPAFGQVSLWQDGSINYLWSAVFSLLYLLPFLGYFRNGAPLFESTASSSRKTLCFRLLFIGYGLLVGGYSEISAFSVIGGAILFLLVAALFHKKLPTIWHILPILSAFVGFFFMLSAPAEQANKTVRLNLVTLLNHFMNETEMYYTRLLPLLLTWIVLFLLCIELKIHIDTLITSVCFLLISLASNYVLVTASFYPDRAMLMCTLYLIMACGTLILPLFSGKYTTFVLCVCSCFGIITAYQLLWGCYDVYRSYNIFSDREVYIAEQQAEGNQDIVTPYIDSWTKYSVTFGSYDLDPTSTTDWPNAHVANYYGLHSIMGCEPDTPET